MKMRKVLLVSFNKNFFNNHVRLTFIFLVTRKEWVEESGSESETEKPKENEPAKQAETKPEIKQQNNTTEGKKIDKSDHETSNDKITNGKAKGSAKSKKPIASNQQTLMSFFKKK